MAFNPGTGSGGSGNIAGSSDVSLSNPQNDHVLTYDSNSSKWSNKAHTGVATSRYSYSIVANTNGTWPTFQAAYPGVSLPLPSTAEVTWFKRSNQASIGLPAQYEEVTAASRVIGGVHSVVIQTVASEVSAPTGAISNLQVNATASQAVLTWDYSGDSISQYVVRRGSTQVGQVSSRSFTDTSVTASTTYNYSVTGNFQAGGTTNTVQKSVTTPQVTPPSETNILAGKTFTSNAGYAGILAPSRVNDGDTSTRWISVTQDNVNISVDLNNSYTIDRMIIHWAGDTTRNYRIDISTNNTSWTTIYTGQTSGEVIDIQTITNFSAATSGRYLRVVCIDRWNSTYGNSIFEIEAFGTVGAGSGNLNPTASFTHTVTNLAVSVNGSGSSDPDGTIASYSWSWGDSTANSSGVTASHTYAAAGTYTVRLTVTDNGGASSSVTRSVTVASGGGGGSGGTYASGLPRQVFAASSFWYKPLPSSTPLDPQSTQKRGFLIQKGIEGWGSASKGYPSWALNNHANTPPIVVVTNNDPIVNGGAGMKLRESNPSGPYFQNLINMFQGLRLPAGFTHNVGGTDGFLNVYNKDTDTYWDFWMVGYDAPGWPGWSSARGHRIENASQKNGVAEPYGGTPPFYYGSNAAGLAQEPGAIKLQELEEGYIRHAITCAVPVPVVAARDIPSANAGISLPAVRSDGQSTEQYAIKMGQRLRLPAGFDVDSPNYHPVTRAVARAFRDYGCFIVDRAGDISFCGENRTSISNGSARWNAVFEGAQPHNVMWDYKGYTPFPWQHLQVLASNYLVP